MKTLVVYVFHEINSRVEHFFKNALFEDPAVDFIVVSNNKSNEFTVPPYVKTLMRHNIGYDFGGWSEALLTHNIYKNYDNFICVNSSVMGPYLVPYYTGKWTDIFINGLSNNVKLFGSTINNACNPHVQSYIFSMDKESLEYLIDAEIFSTTNMAQTFSDAIYEKEIRMSKKILDNGWTIGCLMRSYKDADFTYKTGQKLVLLGDVMFEESRNTLWSEYELVFIKGNRYTPPPATGMVGRW